MAKLTRHENQMAVQLQLFNDLAAQQAEADARIFAELVEKARREASDKKPQDLDADASDGA